jgi:thymidylate synthase (FAD)
MDSNKLFTTDALKNLNPFEIKCLDYGFVRLVDCMPRLSSEDGSIEYAIVQCARISYGMGLKDTQSDRNLLRYMYKNKHTSPFESVKFKFHIKCPKFVSMQILRHRTANVNEFSQRYAELPKNENNQYDYYHPTNKTQNVPGGTIRMPSSVNKQSSISIEDEKKKELIEKELQRTEEMMDQVLTQYKKLIDLGLAKEIARYCLPEAIYTELYWTMDLHNLLHFLQLRMDHHAQAETYVFAKAIFDLIRPLVPTVIECFQEFSLESMSLSRCEIQAIKNKKLELESTSKSNQTDYKKKLNQLGLF